MAVKNYVSAIPLTSVNTANFVGVPIVFSAGGLPAPCFLIRIFNNSTVVVFISYDGGVDAHDFVPIGGVLQLDFQTNSQPNNFIANMKKGTVIAAFSPAAGVGLVTLAGYFQADIH